MYLIKDLNWIESYDGEWRGGIGDKSKFHYFVHKIEGGFRIYQTELVFETLEKAQNKCQS